MTTERTISVRFGAMAATTVLALTALASGPGPRPASAQEWARGGVVETGLLLRKLDGVKRVLMIGAHPDDEDTGLLAALARGQGAETAYLALTRGEGGQNLIGPELQEGLGIVRTGELMAARSRDGARQFFTRAFDFGYSKTADEALSLWPHDELLRDVVWVVRTFRPQVIVSVFTGTPADGHGQHQAAGIMAHEVFTAAADPDRYSDQLEDGALPWQVDKLYRLAWRTPDELTTAVETGAYDPLLGRSHFQVAMESRSQHRSQDMGVAQIGGPQSSGLVLVSAATDEATTSDAFFAGVDTTLAGLSAHLEASARAPFARHVGEYRTALEAARSALRLTDASGALEPLAVAHRALSAALDAAVGSPPARHILQERRATLERAIASASSVALDVRVTDDLVVAGQVVRVDLDLWNGGSIAVRGARPALDVPFGSLVQSVEPARQQRRFSFAVGGEGAIEPDESAWSEDAWGEPKDVAPGTLARWSFLVRLPDDLSTSELYYLQQDKDGAMYRWPEDRSAWAQPGDASLFAADVDLLLDSGRGEPLGVHLAGEATFRGVDKATGEFRDPVLAVPAVSVAVEPPGMVAPEGAGVTRQVTVSLTGYAADGVSGEVALELPTGWLSLPDTHRFELAAEGEVRSAVFHVTAPEDAPSGKHPIRAVARVAGGGSFSERVDVIDYPHIERTLLVTPALAEVSVFPVRVAEGLRVGYVMGSGDTGDEAIRQLGLEVETLGPGSFANEDLDRFDVLVLGIRVYETRPDVIDNNDRLLDFARQGGTVVVQYNKYEYPSLGVAPLPVEMGRPAGRVSVEEAPVRLIDPASPVLTAPNRITEADFDGWIQERGLYFLSTWDEAFTPILEMADPGEEPQHGSLVVAPLGDGIYVFSALSFFRQFPAGVPGAYRLFANLVSLRASDWPAAEGTR